MQAELVREIESESTPVAALSRASASSRAEASDPRPHPHEDQSAAGGIARLHRRDRRASTSGRWRDHVANTAEGPIRVVIKARADQQTASDRRSNLPRTPYAPTGHREHDIVGRRGDTSAGPRTLIVAYDQRPRSPRPIATRRGAISGAARSTNRRRETGGRAGMGLRGAERPVVQPRRPARRQ
jgi:hypothetical protein